MTEKNALEKLLIGHEEFFDCNTVWLSSSMLNGPTVKLGELREVTKKHRALEAKNEFRDRLVKKLVKKFNKRKAELQDLRTENTQLKIDLSLQEKATQAEAEEVEKLKAQLAEQEAECCENCANVSGRIDSQNIIKIECCKPNREYLWYPYSFRCKHYTAKPKVRKCRWYVKSSLSKKYTEEEAKKMYRDKLIGPVEGTWEEE